MSGYVCVCVWGGGGGGGHVYVSGYVCVVHGVCVCVHACTFVS